MKKQILVLLAMMLFASGLFAQNYNMSNTNYTTCSGTFYDSGGSGGDYASSESFTMTFTPSTAGSMLQFVFTAFSTESLTFDYLKIYNGPSTASPLIGTYGGTTSPGTVVASNATGQLTFQWVSDGSVISTGWAASISCVTPILMNNTATPTTVNACSGIFTDPQGMSNYTDFNGSRQMTICSGSAQSIKLVFTTFETNEVADNLKIYDGPNTASPLLGTYSQTTSPGTIASTGSCLTFVWSTDNNNASTPGWVASVSCVVVPSNNECVNATALTINPDYSCGVTTAGTITNATASAQAITPCGGTADDDVWYSFVATNTSHRISLLNVTGSTTDMYHAVYSGTCGALTNISCNDADVTTLTGLTVGATYYVRVYTWTSTPGQTVTFNICVGSPPQTNITACSGTFYDSGGNGGNYSANEDMTYIICPSTAGYKIKLNFTSFDVEDGVDWLAVYDGNSTAAPLVGIYDNGYPLSGPIQASSSNASGCLTFVFHSDGSLQYGGWKATISCALPCQSVNAVLTSTTPAASAGYINICQGGTVNFTGSATYPQNGTFYTQSNATSTFHWIFGDGATANGTNVSHTYTDGGGNIVRLVVTDNNGCVSTNDINLRVRVSTTPKFTGTIAAPTTVCAGQSVTLTGAATATPWTQPTGAVLGGLTFLPDGSGVSYTTGITFTDFTPGQLVTAPSDIVDICLNMEHSYMGDLDITITCPSGNVMILHDNANGGSGTIIGNPVASGLTVDDNTSDLTPGVGLTYCFSPSATNGYIYQSANWTTIATYTDPIGNVSTSVSQVTPGTYQAEDVWTDLIGCPLNGTWTITVTDNLSADNGYIFWWGIDFNPSLYPVLWGFTPTLVSHTWSGPGLASTTTNPVTFNPLVTGTNTYTYSVTDNYGCTYDTTVVVTVNPGPTVSISPASASACAGVSTTLTASGATTYAWSTGGNTAAITVSPATTTTYTVTGTTAGCAGTATVTVTVNPAPSVTLSASPNPICAGTSTTLTAGGATTYSWSGGLGTGTSKTVSPASTTAYTVTGTASGCTATATTTVTVNPNPTVTLTASPNPICAGATSVLTAGGAASYSWSGGLGTGSPKNVTPASTTAYTVTGTTSGCTGTATVTVTVNPNPTVSINPVPATICNGQSSVLTASGATTYNWSGGLGTANPLTVTPASTTAYTVTGTTSGCTGTATATVTVNPNPTVSISPAPATICNGQSSVLTASGATTYNWSGGLGTANPLTVTPASTTAYTVTGTTSGCTGTATATVTVNPKPTVSISPAPATICNGQSSVLTASGATTYNWSGGLGTANPLTVTPGSTTAYTVTGTSLGCTGTATTTVTVNPNPTVSISPAPATICNGQSSVLTASGATTYNWSGGLGTANPLTVTPASTTAYTVTGTTSGCTGTATATVTVNPNPTVSINPVPATICNGQSSVLTASGATTYNWSGGLGTANPLTVTPGSTTAYTVTGTSLGCTGTATTTVTVNPNPTVSINPVPATICNGQSSVLTASGATTYNWSGGLGTANPLTVTPASTTAYTVTGTSLGCTGTATTTVTVNPNPSVSINPVPATICNGQSSVLTASGATTYNWSGGLGTANPLTVTPASTTAYTVTGTSLGCTGTATTTVTVNPNPTVSINPVPATICNGQSSVLTASGATTYNWSGGLGTANPLTVTPASTTAYTVTGTSLGCTGTATATVTVNPNPTVSITPTPGTICAGASSSLAASGATSYNWSGGLGTANPLSVSPLTTTSYTVTGTSLGCTGTATVTVNVNPNLSVSISPSPATICNGNSSVLTASGATTYTWSGGLGTANPLTVSPASTSTYSVTGSSLGCTGSATVTVTVNPNPVVSVNPVPATICNGQSSVLTASGATSYNWSGGLGTANPLTVNPASTTAYTVTGTTLGCTGTATTTVTVNPNPTVSINPVPATICNGQSSVLTASGATTYNWSGGLGTANPLTVTPGTTTAYTVTGTSLGCTGTATTTVTVNPNPTVSINPVPATICNGQSSVLTASGATSYNWSGGLGTSNPLTVNPASTTAYTVTGTTLGCTGTATTTVTVNPNPVVSINPVPATICNGQSSVLTASGATTYNWSGGLGTANPLTVNPATTSAYTVTGTTLGCTGTATTTVTVNPNPTVSINPVPATICNGQTSVLTASGATTYNWSGGLGTANPLSVTPATTASYTVTGTSLGCTGTATTTVTVNPNPTISINPVPATICNGQSSVLTASGATTYNWSGGLGTANPLTVNPATTTGYTVTGTSLGCTGTATTTVTVNPNPTVSINPVPATICNGQSSVLTASGATSYNWSGGLGTANPLTVNPATTSSYTVTGTTLGCTGTATTTVTVNPNPTVSINPVPATICNGASSVLTASGATTYNWSGGLGTANPLTVSPTTTTGYTVTGTSLGCTGTATTTVNVNPLPTVTVPANITICNNGTVSATSFSSTPAGATYTWTNSNTGIGLAASGSGNLPSFTAINAGSTPISATITVTPTLSGCTGPASTYTITVNPTDNPAFTYSPSTLCQTGTDTPASITGGASGTFSASPAGIVFLNTATGLIDVSASALGNYTITFNTSGTCPSSSTASVTITTAPLATFNYGGPYCPYDANPSPTFAPGASAGVFSASPAGLSFVSTATGVVNLAASTPGTYTVTNNIAAAGGCAATSATNTIVINPTPTVSVPAAFAVCNGATVAAAAITGTPAGVTYTWTNSNTAIGLAASGSGVVPSFTASNAGSSPITATITVTPSANGCTGTPQSYIITVNPTPTVSVPANSSICNGTSVSATSFTSPVSGASFAWTNSNTGIGLAASGSGNIASFTATNAGANPITATITVTPSANGCTGTPSSYTITVNPTPVVSVPASFNICNNSATTATSFSSTTAGATYTWTNNTTSIGLAASGTGDIASFNATNATSNPVVSTITVTPSANGCTGTPSTYTITVNPTPVVSVPANITLCNGAAVSAANFTSTTAGCTYTWTNSNTAIGLGASGSGNIAGFNAVNGTASPISATITVTPAANGCTGTASAYTITVNPTPVVSVPANITICNGGPVTAGNFTSTTAGASFAWTNSNTSIGLAASGTGNTPAFTAINNGSTPATATITVTPSANGCTGTASTYTITVNPTDNPAFSYSPSTLCQTGTDTPASITGGASGTFSASPAGLVFLNTATGLIDVSASALGNYTVTFNTSGTCPSSSTASVTITTAPLATFNYGGPYCPYDANPSPTFAPGASAGVFSASPAGLSFVSTATGVVNLAASTPGTYTVTNSIAAAGGCAATSATNTIVINPTPTVSVPAAFAVCNGATVAAAAITGTPAGVTYTWTNSNTAIGLAASGSGVVPSFTASNAGSSPITATITVTPSANGCTGTPQSYIITVNPTPNITVPVNITVCNNSPVAAASFSSTTAGTTYSWTNSNTAIGLAASGNGNIASFTAVNNTASPITATIAVTPSANGCAGTASSYTITVNPTPNVTVPANVTICSGATTAALNFSSTTAGATFAWTNNNTAIGLAASGSGNIAGFTATNAGSSPITATISVTPSANGCSGSPASFTITVNPLPAVSVPTNMTLCNNTMAPSGIFSSSTAGSTYSWTNTNTSIGLAANGTGSITSFTATNTSASPVTATVSVTASANGCSGSPSSYTITVNPSPAVTVPANTAICTGGTVSASNFTSTTAGATFSWTNSNASIGLAASGSGNTPSFTASNTGTAPVVSTITVTASANGCTGTASTYTITVNPLPVISFPAIPSVCVNGSAVTLNGATPVGGLYTGTGVSGGSFNPASSGSGTFVITYTYTSAAGCTNSSTQNITVNAQPVVAITPQNPVICVGTSTTFTASGASTYVWTPATGLNVTTGNAVTASPLTTTTYLVTGTQNGCTNTADVTVNVYTNIPVSITPTTSSICPGSNTPLTASGAVTYTWSPSNTLSGNSGSTVTASPTTTTVYTVIGSDLSGCTGSANAVVSINPLANINFVAVPKEGCAPLDVNFRFHPGNGIMTNSWLWNFGENNATSTDTVTTHTYYDQGTYTVTLSAQTIDGCAVSASDTIRVHPVPVADFLTHPDVTTTDEPDISFVDQSVNATQWTWDFGDPGSDELNSSHAQNPAHNYAEAGDYVITLAVSNQYGCLDTTTRTVTIHNAFAFWIPNAFSPNEDLVNDYFMPQGVGFKKDSYSMRIFDRWGKTLLYTEDIDKGWDGTDYNNGKMQPDGVYTYLIYVTDDSNREHQYIGSVTLLK
jgi:gliding motility-associated-like protein